MTPAEKNKRVAEILGVEYCDCPNNDPTWYKNHCCLRPDLEDYCGNIEAAMGLLCESGLSYSIHFDGKTHEVWLNSNDGRFLQNGDSVDVCATHEELPMAGVDAFLRANGEKV